MDTSVNWLSHLTKDHFIAKPNGILLGFVFFDLLAACEVTGKSLSLLLCSCGLLFLCYFKSLVSLICLRLFLLFIFLGHVIQSSTPNLSSALRHSNLVNLCCLRLNSSLPLDSPKGSLSYQLKSSLATSHILLNTQV